MRKILFGFTVVAVCVGLLWVGPTGTVNALDAVERAQIMCEGKLHVCFKLNNAEMEAFLASVSNSARGFAECANACGTQSTPSCSVSECNDRCLTAAGISGTPTSCQ